MSCFDDRVRECSRLEQLLLLQEVYGNQPFLGNTDRHLLSKFDERLWHILQVLGLGNFFGIKLEIF